MNDEDDIWQEFTANITRLIKKPVKIFKKNTPAKPLIIRPKALPCVSVADFIPGDIIFSKKDARLKKANFNIEAKLDLHGFTQKEAFASLVKFINRSSDDGLKYVLIITGKGLRPNGGLGVLKQKLPMWLDSLPLAEKISGYSDAKTKDGGEGAFYIRLKTQKPSNTMSQ